MSAIALSGYAETAERPIAAAPTYRRWRPLALSMLLSGSIMAVVATRSHADTACPATLTTAQVLAEVHSHTS